MSQYEYIWKEDLPTVCPVNSTHSVDLGSISIEDETGDQIMKIKEETIPTGENFMCELRAINYATGPNVTTDTDFIWPHPINVLELQYVATTENLRDEIKLCVAPNTIIGILTTDAATGATGSNVSSTVTDNIMKGYYVSLFDGVSSFNCGRITNVNEANGIISWEIPPTSSFAATSPTYVRMTVYVINDYTLGPPQRYIIGSGKIGGSYVPANTIVRVSITNNGNTSKTLFSQIEYLY